MDDNNFEMEVNSVRLEIERLNVPGYVAFRIVFSSARLPLVVARATNADAEKFWTSIPEGRQKEAEGVGKLIETYFEQKEKN